MPLMRLGAFVFAVPTYSFESLQRSVSSRAESQMVIGAAPPIHLLGPGEETVSLSSTFFPFHLNGAGLAQLEGIRAACQAQTPMMMVSIGGVVFGRWIIRDVGDSQSFFHPSGAPQKVEVDMSLVKYTAGGTGRSSFRFF
jgi:phage protein U